MFGDLKQILILDNTMIRRKWNKDKYGEDYLFAPDKELTLQLFFDNYCYYHVHYFWFDGIKEILDIPAETK